MAVAFVKNIGSAQTKVNAETLVITTSASSVAGNTIFVRVDTLAAASSKDCTDSASNTYISYSTAGDPRQNIWRADNTLSIANGGTITITWPLGGGFSAVAAAADEFSGVKTASALEGSVTTTGT